jgi:hypothetical protein
MPGTSERQRERAVCPSALPLTATSRTSYHPQRALLLTVTISLRHFLPNVKGSDPKPTTVTCATSHSVLGTTPCYACVLVSYLLVKYCGFYVGITE